MDTTIMMLFYVYNVNIHVKHVQMGQNVQHVLLIIIDNIQHPQNCVFVWMATMTMVQVLTNSAFHAHIHA